MEDDRKTTEEPVSSIRCFTGGRELSEDEVRRAVVRAAVKIFMKKMLKKDSSEFAIWLGTSTNPICSRDSDSHGHRLRG